VIRRGNDVLIPDGFQRQCFQLQLQAGADTMESKVESEGAKKVGQFFDSITSDYSKAIERCFPRYREMLWAVVDYLPRSQPFQSMLEIGCGTGNLSALLHDVYPDAAIRVVDVSAESLDVCRARLSDCSHLVVENADFSQIDYTPSSFDLIVSSIAIHHLPSAAKRTLFARMHQWLTADGVLCIADQCAGANEQVHSQHIRNWKLISKDAGATEQEWDMWMQHQANDDHHDTLEDQIEWLREAGFRHVECIWRYLLWSVIRVQK
jgi:tRNA (cmo5U34)-methyltransferase